MERLVQIGSDHSLKGEETTAYTDCPQESLLMCYLAQWGPLFLILMSLGCVFMYFYPFIESNWVGLGLTGYVA